jgi:uncharacterized iron-regulated protein
MGDTPVQYRALPDLGSAPASRKLGTIMSARHTLALLGPLLVSFACAGPGALTPRGGFVHRLGAEHPLAGRVYSRETQALVEPARLFEALAEADVVLIGEIHDNSDHHLLEAELIARFLLAHPAAHVAFEMLDETQSEALRPPPNDADTLGERVRWQATGWPSFALYRPVFQAVLDGGGTLVAAHPSRERVRASMHGVSETEARELHLSPPLASPLREALVREIADSHCGHAPEAMIEPMVRAQSFKDAFMARALASVGGPVLLVAGSGHVREDRGVPLFLARRGLADALSIRLVGVDDAVLDPHAYAEDAYDFVIFTPRTTDESACDRFKEQLERMKKGHHG